MQTTVALTVVLLCKGEISLPEDSVYQQIYS